MNLKPEETEPGDVPNVSVRGAGDALKPCGPGEAPDGYTTTKTRMIRTGSPSQIRVSKVLPIIRPVSQLDERAAKADRGPAAYRTAAGSSP